jgi:hypothetical protein
MRIRQSFSFLAVAAAVAGLCLGQTPARTRVLGTIQDAQASGASVKTDTGEVFAVVFLSETRFQKVAPGEKDLTKAQSIAAGDLQQGDRVLARGTASADGKTLTAQSVILMSARDIAQKQEKDRAEWLHRGMAGLVISTDPAAKEIKIRIPSVFGQQHLATVVIKDDTRLRRYAPDSVRFSDAKPSNLAEVQPGDQLRALGEKNEDSTRIVADEVVSGRFHTVAGSVTSLNVDAGEIQMKDLQSGKAVTVKITRDAVLRRAPQFPMGGMGGAMGGPGGAMGGPGAGMGGPGAGMRPGGAAAGAGGGNVPAGAGPASPAAGAAPEARQGPPDGAQTAGGPPAGAGPMGGGMRRGPGDFSQMLERMPPIPLTEIKPGEMIIVAGTVGASPDRVTAVTLLAGADALIAMSQAAASRSQGQNASARSQSMGNWNLGDMSMIPMP